MIAHIKSHFFGTTLNIKIKMNLDEQEAKLYIESIIEYIHDNPHRRPLLEHEVAIRRMIRTNMLIVPTKKIQHNAVFHDKRSSSDRQSHLLSAIRGVLLWDIYHCSYCFKHTSER